MATVLLGDILGTTKQRDMVSGKAPCMRPDFGHSQAVSTTISAELAAQLGITSAPTEVYIDVKSKNADGTFVVEIESAEDETSEHASGAEPADEWPATMRTTV